MALTHVRPAPYQWIYHNNKSDSIIGLGIYAFSLFMFSVTFYCAATMSQEFNDHPIRMGIGFSIAVLSSALLPLMGRGGRANARFNAIAESTGSEEQAWDSLSRFDKLLLTYLPS